MLSTERQFSAEFFCHRYPRRYGESCRVRYLFFLKLLWLAMEDHELVCIHGSPLSAACFSFKLGLK